MCSTLVTIDTQGWRRLGGIFTEDSAFEFDGWSDPGAARITRITQIRMPASCGAAT